jgi:DNA-binding HxlR family transcriptional regulator
MGSEPRPPWLRPNPSPQLAYQADVLGRSVQRLGSKWTLLLLRDMGFLKLTRFSQFLRNNPGLTPRVLARRLREMRAEGLVTRSTAGREVSYTLTERGADAIYILLAFLRYGLKHQTRGQPTGGGSGSVPEVVSIRVSHPTRRIRPGGVAQRARRTQLLGTPQLSDPRTR